LKKLLRTAPELCANFLAPYLVYQALHTLYGDTTALIASAIPPLLWSIYELIKTRRLDAISILVIASILFTIAATGMGGSPRLIQIREALITGAVGVMFLVSLAFPRPMIFYLARATMARNTEEGAASFEALWAKPGVPHTFFILTIVWGLGLIVQTALMCYLAYIWTISRYLLISPILGYGIIGLLLLWSFAYIARRKGAGFSFKPAP
jgi:intracellular septation protein A